MILPPPEKQNDPFFLASQQAGWHGITVQALNAAHVDVAAANARAQVVTTTLGQDFEYHEKLSEARLYLSSKKPKIDNYPYLDAMAKEVGGVPTAIATGIMNASATCNNKRARIEAIRTASKARLKHLLADDVENAAKEIELAMQRMQAIAEE